MESKSLQLARTLLGKKVEVIIDRPMGSRHPERGFEYLVNYGYVPGLIAPDGEELDAYCLGVREPVGHVKGVCIAIVHRKNDDDDKLIVVPDGMTLTDAQILAAVRFQEQWFDIEILRS